MGRGFEPHGAHRVRQWTRSTSNWKLTFVLWQIVALHALERSRH